ncbi:MAG: hypothetical protein ACYTAO_05470 [Planctomycetota bacterium]|jgi:hypothetical protein
MLELGNLLSVFGGAHAANTTEKRISSSTEPTRTRTVPDDDAAVADIRHAGRLPQVQQDGQDSRDQLAMSLSIEEVMAAIRRRLDKFRELIEGIRTGRLSAGNLSEELGGAGEGIRGGAATSQNRVFSDVSELLAHLREEISEIQSFEGFLLGVHEKIEEFRPQAEFDLDQLRDVEEHMAEVNSDLELGIFSLARVTEKALRALRCQENLESERALKLLEDDAKKPGVAGQVTPEETAAAGLTLQETSTSLVTQPSLTPDETPNRLDEGH